MARGKIGSKELIKTLDTFGWDKLKIDTDLLIGKAHGRVEGLEGHGRKYSELGYVFFLV